MRKFAIVAQARSGSTLLVDYLNSHPDVVCYHEPFQQKAEHYEYSRYRARSFLNRLYHTGIEYGKFTRFTARWRNIPEAKLNKYKNHFGNCKAAGFKITLNQIARHNPQILKYLSCQNIPVILIQRRSELERFVSLKMARQAKIWHVKSDDVEYPKINPTADEFFDFCENESSMMMEVKEQLKNNDSIIVDYEDLSAEPNMTMKGLFDFLRVPAFQGVHSTLKKGLKKDLSEYVENADEFFTAVESQNLPPVTW